MLRLLSVLALTLAPLFALAEETATPVAAPPQLPAITVAPVNKVSLTDRVIATGLVGPIEQVDVQPQIDGQAVEAVLADMGDRVEAGQVLARLSRDTLNLSKSELMASRASAAATVAQAQASIVEAEANRDEAVRQRDRSMALRAQGNVAQSATDQAVASAISAEANVSVARQTKAAAEAQAAVIEAQMSDVELRLARTDVRAPVAGEVVEKNARLGGIASGQGAPMFVIVKDGALELNADVSEADLLRVAVGQDALIKVVGQENPVPGKVRLVEPTVDTATRLGRARIVFDDQSAVRSGMYGEADIVIARRDGLAVPVTAISGRGSDTTVLRVVDGTVEQVKVATGIRDAGQVEIMSGLAEGDLIVTRAGSFVRPGDRINPVMADAAEASN